MAEKAPISRREALRALGLVATAVACSSGKPGKVTGEVGGGDDVDGQSGSSSDTSTTTDSGTTGSGTTDSAGSVSGDTSVQDAPVVDAGADGGAPDSGLTADVTTTLPAPIPHITPNDDHFVTSCCITPNIDAATWSITLLDRGKPLGTIDQKLLQSLQGKQKEHTLECISASPYHGSISNAIWTGLPLLDIFAKLGVQVPKDVTTIKLAAADDYSTGVPVTDLDRPIWLVWQMNGADIPMTHGYPARLLLPGRYGTKNPKWLTSLEFLDTAYTGYWEETGWSDDASYKPNTLIRSPKMGQKVPKGLLRLQGTAFAGSDPVVAVDVRVGSGSWQPAVLDYSPGADIWTLWHFDVQVAPGAVAFQVRCTTKSGAMSLDTATPGLGGYDGSMKLTVAVV